MSFLRGLRRRGLRRLFTRTSTEYHARYRTTFGVEPDDPRPAWIRFPFAWGTPEADILQRAIWHVDNLLWKRFIETIVKENIPGDLVEFGVFGGNSLEQLIGYAESAGWDRRIFGFDSFEGLPAPTAADPTCWHKGQYAAPLDAVAERLRAAARPSLRLVKGWFAESLSRPDIQGDLKQIAFARIDGDLYESAVSCLSFLDGRLSDGAFLCFDDWTDDPRTGETRAFFEFADRVRGKYRFEPICRLSLGAMHLRVRTGR